MTLENVFGLEGELLGAILLKPGLIDQLEIDGRLFVSESNQQIFHSIQELYVAHGYVDPGLVAADLSQKKVHGSTIAALMGLAQTGLSIDPEVYALELREFERYRMARTALQRAYKALEAEKPYEETIGLLEAELASLQSASGGLGYDDYLRDAEAIVRGEGGKPTGFVDLDRQTGGLIKGGMVVLAGRPSMGKSSMARQIVHNHIKTGGRACYFTFDQAGGQVLAAEAARISRIPLGRVREATMSQAKTALLSNALAQVGAIWREHVDLYSSDPTLSSTLSRARQSIRRGSDLVVLDYGQLVDAPGKDINERSSIVSKAFKRLAQDFGVFVVVLAQLNRDVEKRQNRRPIMSDLRDSGQWEQDADQIWALYRDEYYNPHTNKTGIAELLILKQKLGPVGTVELSFQEQFAQFADLAVNL